MSFSYIRSTINPFWQIHVDGIFCTWRTTLCHNDKKSSINSTLKIYPFFSTLNGAVIKRDVLYDKNFCQNMSRITISKSLIKTMGELLVMKKTCLYFLDEMSLSAARQIRLSCLNTNKDSFFLLIKNWPRVYFVVQ